MTAKVWCDDWRCPARVSCAHHFGRSAAYAAMKPAKVESVENTFRYDRTGSKDPDACAEYRFDKPKEWLVPKPWQGTHGG